jgi:RNA polymerase sigma-70 factor (ECF subfamily)
MHTEPASELAREAKTLAALRERDEDAFADFVVRHAASMRRVAASITRNTVLAEEAVQDTWLAVLKGIGAFEARASIRTWVFRILVNRARTLVVRESRAGYGIPERPEDGELPERRFRHPAADGHWTEPLADWGRSPEDDMLAGELRAVIDRALGALSPAQREVVTLRDIEGWHAAEVCNVLVLTEVHQRVLLHRGRTRIRAAIEAYYVNAEGDADAE